MKTQDKGNPTPLDMVESKMCSIVAGHLHKDESPRTFESLSPQALSQTSYDRGGVKGGGTIGSIGGIKWGGRVAGRRGEELPDSVFPFLGQVNWRENTYGVKCEQCGGVAPWALVQDGERRWQFCPL